MTSQVASSPHSRSQNSAIDRLNRRYSGGSFYLRECPFGLGVFARRPIGRGELILTINGPLIDFAETKRRGSKECMAIQIGPDRYIDTQPPAVFVNHSCAPNAGIKRDRFLVARRTIRAHEEICYDYSTTMEEQSFTMECLCGTAGCRHVVRDFSTLPRSVREQYLAGRIVMGFIRARMLALPGKIGAPLAGTFSACLPHANAVLDRGRERELACLGRNAA